MSVGITCVCWLMFSAKAFRQISLRACSTRCCAWPGAVGAFANYATLLPSWQCWAGWDSWSGIKFLHVRAPQPRWRRLMHLSTLSPCRRGHGCKRSRSPLPARSHPQGLTRSSSLLRQAGRFERLTTRNCWRSYLSLPLWSDTALIRRNWYSSRRQTETRYCETELEIADYLQEPPSSFRPAASPNPASGKPSASERQS